jgi:hypothetical protein
MWLGNELKGTERPINILLCHHHPTSHPIFSESKDYEAMHNGQRLIELLSGEWIIIHGHRHAPGIRYATGGTDTPVIFSSGSFGSVLYPELQTRARNQLYFLEIPINDGASLVGNFKAWSWSVGQGWKPSGEDEDIPRSGGFGFRGDLRTLSSAIEKKVRKDGPTYWSEISQSHPEVPFILPSDLKSLSNLLNRKKVTLIYQQGVPFQVGKDK